MSDSQEAKKQEWLADIAADQETTEADYARPATQNGDGATARIG